MSFLRVFGGLSNETNKTNLSTDLAENASEKTIKFIDKKAISRLRMTRIACWPARR